MNAISYRPCHTFALRITFVALACVGAVLADTFTVTNTADSGDGSLPQAIKDAHDNPGPDTIAFNIPGDGVHTIALSRPPEFSGDLTVDGTTQPGYAGSNLIRLSGVANPYGAVIVFHTVTLHALTIVNGLQYGIENLGQLTMTDCVVSGCGGHGIYGDGTLTLTNCDITGNSTSGDGGGILANGGVTMTNCRISRNSAGGAGGGVIAGGTDPSTLLNCEIVGNFSGSEGGGVACGAGLTLINCTVAGNTALTRGGGISISRHGGTFTNCTFAGNTAKKPGGAIYFGGTKLTLYNCILWGDSQDEIYGGAPTVSYSNVQGGFSGTGNINVDPLFVDPSNGDLHLSAGSPCIDAADNTAVPSDITTDLDGNPRFLDDPDTTDTGKGAAPIVDMGAFEFQPPPPINRGDTNCDGSINATDIDSFVTALVSQSDYQAQFPKCNYLNADINQDASVDFNDIDGFVDCLINNGCP